MENQQNQWIEFATRISIAANFLFVIWILYNGINEGFEGTFYEKISYISLMVLLTVNALLLLRKAGK